MDDNFVGGFRDNAPEIKVDRKSNILKQTIVSMFLATNKFDN